MDNENLNEEINENSQNFEENIEKSDENVEKTEETVDTDTVDANNFNGYFHERDSLSVNNIVD